MIYLDASATTALLPGVLEAMVPWLGSSYGNPSSRHPFGQEARKAVESARATLAAFLSANAGEIVFTASGTEAINLAFRCGATSKNQPIFLSATEHACSQDAAKLWKHLGWDVRVLPVNQEGVCTPEVLSSSINGTQDALVSLIWVNNETGAVNPVEELSAVCRSHGARLHLDAVQAVTRIGIDLSKLPCDYLSLAAHKFHGPKGAGGLFIRAGVPRCALMPGHQEFGLRGGTENVAAIVGAAAALSLQPDWREANARLRTLRDQLEQGILQSIPGAKVNAVSADRVGNISSIFFPDRNAADLVSAFGQVGVCVSAGAACSTGGDPSHVLMAMGLGKARAQGSVRFSLSRLNSQGELAGLGRIAAQVNQGQLNTWGNE